jgi:hypothetical protein
MRSSRNLDILKLIEDKKFDNNRRHGRVKLQDITCNVGEVLDLSLSGMRIRAKHRPPAAGTIFVAAIQTPTGPCEVLCRLVWSKKVGFFKHECGVRFDQVTPKAMETLQHLARGCINNEMFRDQWKKQAS